jgi:hypothetical protein
MFVIIGFTLSLARGEEAFGNGVGAQGLQGIFVLVSAASRDAPAAV